MFSAEETRIRERLDELGESEKDQLEAQQLSRQLVEKLLWPISGQMYDMENFHRRQAAAALNYIIDPNEDIQKMIRAWIKSMKDSNFGKYLEAIIVALKHAYEDNIGGVLEKLISSHQEEIELEENESDLVETLAENLEYTMQIATKLSQTLGVGKLKSPLKELLVLFFQVGLKHAFSEVKSLGFLRLLEVFMKLLPDSSLLEVGKYYESCLDNVSDEMKTFLGGHINIGGDAEEFLNDSLKRFTSHLTNIVSGPPLKYLYNLPVGGGKAKRPSTTVESKKKKNIKAPPVVKSSSSIVSSRPKRKNREQKSYQELSGTESEEEEEEEEDIQPSPKRTKILARQSRPSNISTISELTQDSFHIPDEIEQDTNENDQYNTPVKKRSRHTLSISSPIHQIGEINEEVVDEEEEEGLDDNHHWGKPTREVEELKHSDPVLGLHLEDFGTGQYIDTSGNTNLIFRS